MACTKWGHGGNKLLKLPRGQEDTEIGRLALDINHLTTTLLAAHNEERAVRLKREVDERKYHAIFDNADSGIYIANSEGLLESWNRALANLFLLPQMSDANSVIKLTALPWHSPQQLTLMMHTCIADNKAQAGDLEFRCENGSTRWFHVALTPIGEQKAQGLVSDVSEHKNAEALARRETITDPLTGLLNRRGFFEHAEGKIANFKMQPGKGFTLVLIDLDGFKRINDAMGLRSGDKILASSASRLQSCLKASDVVARLGGDTFGVILQATSLEEHVIGIGARIVSTLGAFF
jgi:PAS domain S-box-containing protein